MVSKQTRLREFKYRGGTEKHSGKSQPSNSPLFLSLVVKSILQYNGGAVIAMAGKNCVAICSDLRLGAQAQTIAMDFEKVCGVF